MSLPSANASLLKVARQARGKNQKDLAAASGITQAAVSKLEAGVIQPTQEVLERLAHALSFPVSLFYETDPMFGVPISVSYRKRASVGSRAVEQVEAEVNFRLMHLRRLLASIDYQPELSFPQFDVDEYGGLGSRVAELVRKHWYVPSGPLPDLTTLAERAGCLVLPCAFDAVGVDGLTLHPPGLPVCVFLNESMPGDRQRFTLAHELGHAIMHRHPNPDMEQQADDFASELLMPTREIRIALADGVTLPRLAALKPVWRVSMGALLMRAKRLGCVTDSQSSYLWRQMSKLGYRTREPVAVPAERPSVFSSILQAHLGDLGYGMEELGKLLHMQPEELKVKYGLGREPGKLRIVR